MPFSAPIFIFNSVRQYTPASEPNLIFWREADSGITIDTGVSSWTGPGGPAFEQATTAFQPAFNASDRQFGGKPSIAPDGADDVLDMATSIGPYAQPITWYAVVTWDTPVTDYLWDQTPTGTLREALLDNGAGQFYVYAGATLTGVGLPNDHIPFVMCLVYDGVSTSVYADDMVTAKLSGDGGTDGLDSIRLFARYSDESFFSGKLAAIGSFEASHDVTTRERISNYLVAKYRPVFPISNARAFFLEGDYSESAGTGTWTAYVGTNATAAGSAPKSSRNAPLFFPETSKATGSVVLPLASTDTWVDLIGAFDHHIMTVIDVNHIDPDGGIINNASIFHTNGGNGGISLREVAGSFFADYFYASGASGDSATFDSWKYASVDVSSYLSASGRGRLAIQAKKEGGFVWIRANNGAWVQGDAAYDMWDSAQSATLFIGTNYAQTAGIDGTIRALGFYKEVKDDTTWSNLIAAWATSNFVADSTRTGIWNLGNYSSVGGVGGVGLWTASTVDLGPSGRDFTSPDVGNSPADITINSLIGANTDGVDDYADTALNAGQFLKENGREFTIGVAFLPSNPTVVSLGYNTTVQAPYNAPGLISDSAGYFTLAWAQDDAGVVLVGGVYDAQPRDNGGGDNDGWQMVEVACPADVPHYGQLRLRGSAETQLLEIRVDGGAWVALPCAACQVFTGVLRLGANYAVASFVDADFGIIHIDRVALTDAECNARGLEAQNATGWSLGF